MIPLTTTDRAIHALGIDRDFYREQCGMLERLRDETKLKHEAEIAALNAKLDEALQVAAALAVEGRAA